MIKKLNLNLYENIYIINENITIFAIAASVIWMSDFFIGLSKNIWDVIIMITIIVANIHSASVLFRLKKK